jgi:hypothetical protein
MRAVLLLLLIAALPGRAQLSPRETVERLDSLIRAGTALEARALCTGQALRLVPLLIETQRKISAYLDTARSVDTVLEEKRRGDWTALRVRSRVVFTRPLMGLNGLTSLQAVHLYREAGVWKVADLEELANEKSALTPRQGFPAGVDTAASLLPVSRRVPERRGATRLRMRVFLRGGDSLPALPASAGQTPLDRGLDWARVETRRAPLPDTLAKKSKAPSVYLASTADLDLTDPLLKAKAAALKKGSRHDLETTRRIYAFVSKSFDYKLGASLFSNSREALRGMKGDCSEAAVLTAALLRAAKIPSRVVMGFATIDKGVFIGHAWAEAWLGSEWIGIDAALHEFPAGPGRVALVQLPGDKPMQPIATNLMMRTLANLDIEITEAWTDGEKVPLKEQRGSDKEVREFLDKVMKGMSE